MIKEKKYYGKEDMIKLDQEREFIPLTFDGMFKALFKKDLNLLKDFILSQLSLDVDMSEDVCKVRLFDSELAKDKYNEYQKTVDIYVELNNIYVNVEINREYFKNVEKRNFLFADKLHTMLLQRGDNVNDLEDTLFVQINLNAVDKYDDNKQKLKFGTDKVVYYGLDSGKIYNSNKFVYVKFLEYYRDLYYNKGEELDESCLWLVLFTSRSFLEMYNILGKLFEDEKREQFIRNVIDMNDDKVIFQDWELEKLNELVKYTSEKNLKEDALKEGREEGFIQGREEGREEALAEADAKFIKTIENMLKENIDIDMISRITGKTEKEILEIKEKI